MTVIDQAYAEVERVTRARAKNFAYGIMVLPREKRRANPTCCRRTFGAWRQKSKPGKPPMTHGWTLSAPS